MAKFTPIGSILKKYGIEEEEDNSNIYDDGSVWSLPETPSVTPTSDYVSPITKLLGSSNQRLGIAQLSDLEKQAQQTSSVVEDELASGRNQMQYYTNKLNDLGVEEEKPNFLKSVGKGLLSTLVRIGAIPGTASNTVAGYTDSELTKSNEEYKAIESSSEFQKLKEMGYDARKTENGVWQLELTQNADTSISKQLEAQELLNKAVKNNGRGLLEQTGDKLGSIGAGLKSGASTASGLITGEYSDKNVDWGKVLNNQREHSDTNVSGLVKTLESPGYALAKGYGHLKASHILLTYGDVEKAEQAKVSDETAQNVGNLLADLGIDFFLSGKIDVDGAGKALKTLNKADDIAKINKIANIDDAMKIAKKYNNFDDYVTSLGEKASKYSTEELQGMFDNYVKSYAKDITRDAQKGLGGVTNFEGLKVGKKVVLTPEQLTKISKDKVQSNLLKAGLSLYSPVAGLVNNKVVDKVAELYNKTEIGQSLNSTVSKAFKGGANNEWINSMKNNPEKALEYANERKQMKLTKKMGDTRIQNTMDTINKYSNIKETPEELTKVIENPTTRVARQIEVEREIVSPEYISKMMNLGKNERQKLITAYNVQKSNLNKQLLELKSVGEKATKNKELIAGLEQEIANIEKRLDNVTKVASSKSIDFNKHMKKFGYKADYTDMFNKALTTDIEDLVELVGDRDLAEALQESANRVMDNLDKEFNGLSDYFTSYKTLDGVDAKNFSKFEGEETLDRAKKSNVSFNLDEYRTNKDYKTKVDNMISYRERLNETSSKVLSKENPIFSKSGYEGSGNIVDDLKDISAKRNSGEEMPSLGLTDYYKEIKKNLDELKNTPKEVIEKESKAETKARKAKIKQLEKQLDKMSLTEITDGRKVVNPDTGLIEHEVNNLSTDETQSLVLEMYKKELNQFDDSSIRRKVKEMETEGLGYIEKKSDAKKVAKELIEDLHLDKTVDEVAEELMHQGADYLGVLKKERFDEYFGNVMKLSDDEIEIIKREFRRKENWKVGYKSKKVAQVEEEELKKALDVVKVEKDNIAKWTKEDEVRRETVKYYDGNNDAFVDRILEYSDNARKKKAKQNEALYDELVERYGEKNGKELYNRVMKTNTEKEKQSLKKAIQEADKNKKLAEQLRKEGKTEAEIDKIVYNKPPTEHEIRSMERKKRLELEEKQKLEEFEVRYQEQYNKFKEHQERKNALSELANKVKKSDYTSPLEKEVEKGLPKELQGIKALTFNTEKGEILIDSSLTNAQLKKILSTADYDANKVGTRVVYTNKDFGSNTLGRYYYNNGTIYINVKNLTKKQVNTVLEHEVGHKVMQQIIKANPDLTEEMVTIPFLKYYRNLDEDAKSKFIKAVTKANKMNAPTEKMMDLGMITRYLNKITKEGADLTTISREGFAELYSLFNNSNKSVQRLMKQVDKDAYENFVKVMASYTPSDVVEVSKTIRKRLGDSYADQFVELSMKKDAVDTFAQSLNKALKKAKDIVTTKNTMSKIEEDIKHLEHLMDNVSYDEAGNMISRDYEEFFERMKELNPSQAKIIEEQAPKYKKLFSLEEEVLNIDNTKKLSKEAKEFMEEYKKEMKDIAIREGIYNEEDAEAFATYVMHEINPKFKEDAELIEKGRKLKEELTDPLNVHGLSRKKQGTIEEINNASYNQDGIRIFEENINRLMLKRRMDSEKLVFKKQQLERILEEFAVPIISDFDKTVNDFDHMFDRVGNELMDKLDLSKAELKKLYQDKYGNSYKFVKEHLFEDFKAKYDNISEKLFRETVLDDAFSSNGSDRLKNRVKKQLEDNDFDGALETLFKIEHTDLDKYNYAETFINKYGYEPKYNDPMDNIPMYTEDGRPYVYKPRKDSNGVEIPYDLSKEMPYGIEGGTPYTTIDAIGSYNNYVYKTAKEKNMIIVTVNNTDPEKVIRRTLSDTAMEEAITDRTKLAEKISELMTGDKEAIEGFDALAGFNVIDPKKIKYEEFIVDKSKKYLIDKDAWANYQKAIKDAEYKEKDALLKMYDGVSDIFKSQAIFSIGFHERNAIQNVIASYIKTGANLLDPKLNKEAFEILAYKAGNGEFNKAYGGYNIDEILKACEDGGMFETQVKNVFDKDHTKKFLQGETDALKVKENKLNLNPFSTDFVGYRKSQELAETIESQAKIVNILTHLENGMDLSDAIEMTKQTLFDYSDITQFESKVMRRAIPFYTFMRKNIPSQFDNMMNHSARLARTQSIYRKSSERFEDDRERALRPDYLDGQLAIGNQKYLNLGDATQDLKKLTDHKEMLSGLNPIIKTPLELLFNKQLYSDSDVSKYDKTSEKIQYATETAIPMYRQVSALHKMITGTQEEKKKAENTLSKAFGSLVNEYDIKKQEKSTMYDYIEQLQNQYYEYIEKHPEKLKELEEKKALEKQNNSKTKTINPLSKLLK